MTPDAVHLGNDGFSKIAQTRIRRLSTTVAYHVPALVGEVHHANAELIKNLQIAQLVGDGVPVMRQRDAVSGHVEAVLSRRLNRLDVVGDDRLGNMLAQHVGRVSEAGKSLDETHRILTLLPRVLKNARYPRGAPGLEILALFLGTGDAAGNAHVLTQIFQLRVGGAREDSGLDRFAVDCGTR